jgi:hypothetical protein
VNCDYKSWSHLAWLRETRLPEDAQGFKTRESRRPALNTVTPSGAAKGADRHEIGIADLGNGSSAQGDFKRGQSRERP